MVKLIQDFLGITDQKQQIDQLRAQKVKLQEQVQNLLMSAYISQEKINLLAEREELVFHQPDPTGPLQIKKK